MKFGEGGKGKGGAGAGCCYWCIWTVRPRRGFSEAGVSENVS